MAYTAQNLEHAVSVFYSSEHSERAEAHKWLTAAQRCPEAWSFVWELLQSQKVNIPMSAHFDLKPLLHEI